jgi:hypothetical protein
MSGVVLAVCVWAVLFVSGYVALGLLPLDPHNPVALPGRASRAFTSFIAATAVVIAPALQGNAQLFLVSLGVGLVVLAGLNEPYRQRRSEQPSLVGRFMANKLHRFAGAVLLKVPALLVAWLSSVLWEPLWLVVPTALTTISLQGRVGVLILRGKNVEELAKDVAELFGKDVPRSIHSLEPETAKSVLGMSERQIRDVFPDKLGDELIRSKRLESLMDWYRPPVVFRRMFMSLAGLCVWAATACMVIFEIGHIGIGNLHWGVAWGIIAGAALGLLLH